MAAAPLPAVAAIWESIGPDGGRVDGFAQAPSDPNRMYALPHRQGVMRSTDRGLTWSHTRLPVDGDTWSLVAVCPQDPDLVLAGFEGDLLTGDDDSLCRSTDAGSSWHFVPVGPFSPRPTDLVFDPFTPNVALATFGRFSDLSIYRTTDAGLTWLPANDGLGKKQAHDIAFHPDQPGVVLAGTEGGIYRSTDHGASWGERVWPSQALSLSFSGGPPLRLWARIDGLVAYSEDGGNSFAFVNPLPDCNSAGCGPIRVLAHPTNPQIVLVSANQVKCIAACVPQVRLYGSTDAGQTWSTGWVSRAGFETEIVRSFTFDHDDPNRAYVAIGSSFVENNETGMLRTLDFGASWERWAPDVRALAIARLDRDATGNVYARRGGLRGLWKLPFASSTWEELNVPGGADPPVEYFNSPSTFEVVDGAGAILHEGARQNPSGVSYSRSTNGGITWARTELLSSAPFPEVRELAGDPGGGPNVWVWVDGDGGPDRLHRSTDAGGAFPTEEPSVPVHTALADPDDPTRLVVLERGTGRVYVTATYDEWTWQLRGPDG